MHGDFQTVKDQSGQSKHCISYIKINKLNRWKISLINYKCEIKWKESKIYSNGFWDPLRPLVVQQGKEQYVTEKWYGPAIVSFSHIYVRTKGSDTQVERCSRCLGSRNVGSFERVKWADRSCLGVAARQILARLGKRWALVDQQWNVDAHDCHDAAHIQVDHENPLRMQRHFTR